MFPGPGEADNVYSVSVGNLKPRMFCRLTLRYVCELESTVDGIRLSLPITSCRLSPPEAHLPDSPVRSLPISCQLFGDFLTDRFPRTPRVVYRLQWMWRCLQRSSPLPRHPTRSTGCKTSTTFLVPSSPPPALRATPQRNSSCLSRRRSLMSPPASLRSSMTS